jgi:hypothetical protein
MMMERHGAKASRSACPRRSSLTTFRKYLTLATSTPLLICVYVLCTPNGLKHPQVRFPPWPPRFHPSNRPPATATHATPLERDTMRTFRIVLDFLYEDT